jgi:hypothetical protein
LAFLKLDCGILNSTIWYDKPARDIFLTALLMARPCRLSKPIEQLDVHTMKPTGFVLPAGDYGFVDAAGPGIVHKALVEHAEGMAALDRLGSPEAGSRTSVHAGRRLIRIDGGYIAVNYDAYRRKDHTAALRMKRLRAKKRDAVTSRSNAVTRRNVTQAEEEAEAEAVKGPSGVSIETPTGSPATPGGHGLTDWMIERWGEQYQGQKPTWPKASYIQLARLLKRIGDEEVRTRWPRYLADASDFFAGHPLVKFATQADRWIKETVTGGNGRHRGDPLFEPPPGGYRREG